MRHCDGTSLSLSSVSIVVTEFSQIVLPYQVLQAPSSLLRTTLWPAVPPATLYPQSSCTPAQGTRTRMYQPLTFEQTASAAGCTFCWRRHDDLSNCWNRMCWRPTGILYEQGQFWWAPIGLQLADRPQDPPFHVFFFFYSCCCLHWTATTTIIIMIIIIIIIICSPSALSQL